MTDNRKIAREIESFSDEWVEYFFELFERGVEKQINFRLYSLSVKKGFSSALEDFVSKARQQEREAIAGWLEKSHKYKFTGSEAAKAIRERGEG